MYSDLNVFQLAYSMARHAGHRQAVVAQNLANADTPNYAARDITPFREARMSDFSHAMTATRPGHLAGSAGPDPWVEFDDATPADPNRNSVSVELEMMKGVEAKRQHDRAIAIYKSSLAVLRASLGRG